MMRLFAALALLHCTPSFAVDNDADGWEVEDGDCVDTNDQVNPGLPEACGDHLDNNCDGFFDEGCDYRAQQATVRGGGCAPEPAPQDTGGATSPTAPTAAFVPLFALLWRRRK